MGIKFYKLNYYKPYWTMDTSIVPYDHIETIVAGIQEQLNTAQNSSEELWEEMQDKNFEWVDMDTIHATGTTATIPNYLKVDVNGHIYYYYLLNLGRVVAVKDNKTYYAPEYLLDRYMTMYCNKLHIMYDKNPNVYQLFGFDNRWKTRTTSNGTEYVIDFVSQRYLSNTLPRNNMMVRELAYYTSANTLFTLNFSDVTPPANVTFTKLGGSDSETRTWSQMTTANSRGRYEYIIAKSTALMTADNSKLKNSNTSQKFVVIPLFADLKDDILHALNDFDVSQNGNVLDPWGENQIGLYECDIPYSIFYGYNNKSEHGVTLNYIEQKLSDSETKKVCFFQVNNNAPMVLKIIDYTQYAVGFYGKFKYFIENVEFWTPETEPALWNPTYYKEVYNNGNSNLITDASFFIWKWDGTSILEMGVQAYLSWQDSLNIAYNYGNNTNSALATLDNTETQSANLSISNMYFGSASANYFTNNATTTATSLSVRNSEQAQAWTDAALDTAKAWNNAAPTSIIPWKIAMQVAKGATNAALTTAKVMTDTALSQQRANEQLRSGINNLTSSPASVLSNPSTKGVIPNKLGLFETYSIKLHPNDEKAIFVNYCNNGYPTNEIKLFQNVFNRQIMNVLHLDTTYFKDVLKNILLYNDNTIFNTPSYNAEFLSWMNEPHKVYNTWWLVNCTDYYSTDYLSNIELELPEKPTSRTHINRYITTLKDVYAWDNIKGTLQSDNPTAPEDIWNDIEIINITQYGFIIKSKESSTTYYGTILVQTTVYDGYILDVETKHYFFGNTTFLQGSSTYRSIKDIIMPDGTIYKSDTFNLPIIFNTNVSNEEILTEGFLQYCDKFNQSITLPSNLKTIPKKFLNHCVSFNQDLTIPDSVTTIGSYFLYNHGLQEKTITLGAGLTNVNTSFMLSINKDIDAITSNATTWTINIGELSTDIFTSDGSFGYGSRLCNTTNPINKELPESYTTGISIIGTYKTEFIDKYSSYIFELLFRYCRKLI